ncbi:MAG: chromate transporter [Coriobacteriales bacterium]
MSVQEAAGKRGGLGQLLKELLGIGCIGFGGGSALIPVFQERLAGRGLVSQRQLDDAVAVACITPGALPVEMSAGLGMERGGSWGALLAASALALPGVLLLVLVLVLLGQSTGTVVTQVGYLAVGVSAYILSVIARYVHSKVTEARTRKGTLISLAVVVLVFAATCGKSLYKLLGLTDAVPLLAIGTVNAMALTFFLAVWIRDKRSPGRVAVALCVAGAYCLTQGGLGKLWEHELPLDLLLIACMVVMALWSLAGDARESGARLRLGSPKPLLGVLGVSALAVALCALPALLLCADTAAYLANGAVSSLLSFGGGDAYIAMADGFFVESGMLPEDEFYAQLVPVANALPGSILCKVLTGAGYLIGAESGGVAAGLAVALAGFAVAIAMSCITFAAGYWLFEALDGLKSFAAIKRVIGCVVSGLLLTVALGLLVSCSKGAPPVAGGSALTIALCLALAVVNGVLAKRLTLHPLAAVLASAAVSCLLCNLIGLL